MVREAEALPNCQGIKMITRIGTSEAHYKLRKMMALAMWVSSAAPRTKINGATTRIG